VIYTNITKEHGSPDRKETMFMSEKRRDSKNRILRTGESQEADGRYKFRYIDANGKRKSVYSWRLVATDSIPAGKKTMRLCESRKKPLIEILMMTLSLTAAE